MMIASKAQQPEILRNSFRCLKVTTRLLFIAAKFYLLAWLVIPKALLAALAFMNPPQSLNELEYQANSNPGSLIFTALIAVFLFGVASYRFYVLPALIIAKNFFGGAV